MNKIITITFIILWGNLSANAQNFTLNDSFEGQPQQAIPPPHWNNCDAFSSVDTQPGFLGTTTPASHGLTYVSLVTRELNPPGTVETVWADLINPLEINTCSSLSLDLSLSRQFYGVLSNWQTYYFDNPCILQVFGFNGDCDNPADIELLWESDVLDHYYWKTFEITLNPTTNTFQRIAFRVFFTPPTNWKNSALFIDNLRFTKTDVLGNDVIVCEDEVVILNASTPDATYIWQDSSSDSIFIVTSPGIYWVDINRNNCVLRDSIIVTHKPKPVVDLGPDTSLCFTDTILLDAYNNNAIYQWQDYSNFSTFNVTRDGVYWVVVNINNCKTSDTINIFSPYCEPLLQMPNIFTPNNDGLNDYFKPIKFKNLYESEINVYDRWGTKLFESTKINLGWNGKKNDIEYNDDTYFWVITGVDSKNNFKKFTGTVKLIK